MLETWLGRRTKPAAVRRVADLPIALGSDVGSVRSDNQDRCVLIRASRPRQEECTLVAVLADGMGGMAEGGRCATMAVAAFAIYAVTKTYEPLCQRLQNACFFADARVYEQFKGKGGATLSAIAISGIGQKCATNVGDSRIYLLHADRLTRLTTDDTLKEQHPSNNSYNLLPGLQGLLQFIGVGPELEPHQIPAVTSTDELQRLLLTSDGAHTVGDDILYRASKAATDAGVLVKRIIDISIWLGGNDNASAICIDTGSLTELFVSRLPTESIEVWDSFGELTVPLRLNSQYSERPPQPKLANSGRRTPRKKKKASSAQVRQAGHPIVPQDEPPELKVKIEDSAENGNDEK